MRASRRARAATAIASSTAAVRPALGRQYLSWERRPLDADAMHRAAQALLGENDFSAFRTVHCQAPHAMREMQAIRVRRDGDIVEVEVQANAFLHHMVRNIVGSLLMVGSGEQARRLDRANCWPAATAPSPGRPRRRRAWCSWGRAIPAVGPAR